MKQQFKIIANKKMELLEWARLYLFTLVALGFLDTLWIGLFFKNVYIKELPHFLRLNQGNIDLLWAPAISVYLFLAFGLVFFVLAQTKDSISRSFFMGGIFGLITYGIYDLTSLSIFRDWPLLVSYIDMLWGAFLCGFTAVIVVFLERNFKNSQSRAE